jgi:hypothetical protein
MNDRPATAPQADAAAQPQASVPHVQVTIGRLRVGSALSRWERAALPDAVAGALAERYAAGLEAVTPPPPGAGLAERLAAAVHRALPKDLPGGRP